MDLQPPVVMSFPTLDQAESALDWIGLEFADAEGAFEGRLAPDDADLLDAAIADPDSPEAVRALASALREVALADPGAAWRVAFAD
jgi:hypothetical protein